ncbi:glucose-6-phosphate dehydrogenase [Lacticaseibacillus paracasei]|uniref:glucose-6-phosphate dehydrogenase n=1 Tax=Lacticaseibacillus paracasei TaxID=1597 RepID=UPI0005EAE560|nr:glucose-6-phosphate dehydrogenase [Lacticaseibacillus paracasei]
MPEESRAVIIIFGGSGDLASRKLYPALFNLYRRGVLAEHFAVIGTARRPWTDDHYHEVVENAVAGDDVDRDQAKAFAQHFFYQSHDVTDADHYITLKNLAAKLDDQYVTGGNRIFYMAMAPDFFETIASHLKSEHLLTERGFNRLIIEKPFGHDYARAKELNDSLTATFDDDQIFRIDHYLGKEMIQNLLAFRFDNAIFEGVWNKDYIDNIQITLSEAVGVEERAGYYEKAGALRDMVQNHVMQVLSYLTMPKPKTFTANDILTAKDQVFAALKPYDLATAKENFVRAQYASAEVDGDQVLGYRQEEGVAANSQTATFVAGKIMLDMPQWEGVPVYIRTGKRLTRKSTQLTLTFKPVASPLFNRETGSQPDSLTIYIEPSEGYSLQLNGKALGTGFNIEPDELRYRHDPEAAAAAPEAYERLINNVLEGDQTNFTHWSELSASWRFIDAIQAAWSQETEMPTYPAATMGPQAAFDLLARDGRQWFWQPRRIKLAD